MEQISPELALVDPELARRARAGAMPARAAPRRSAAPAQQDRRRRGGAPTLVLVVLCASLAGNGMLIARLLAGTQSARTVTQTVTSTVSAAPALSSSSLERQLLAGLLQDPQRLPRQWIDAATGLPRRNLQARCGAASALVSCVVHLAGAPAARVLRVQYATRPGFIWTAAGASPAHRPRSHPARRRG